MTARALDAKNRRRISVAEITEEATVGSVKKAINRHLHYQMVKDRDVSTNRDYYFALAYAVKDQMITRWFRTQQHYYQTDPKVGLDFRFYAHNADYFRKMSVCVSIRPSVCSSRRH